MAAGGFPLDDTDATLNALQDMMPIKVRRYTLWFVLIDVAA